MTELTAEQELILNEYVEEWTKIGLATNPIDKQKAEKALRASYKFNKYKPPKMIWCRSPKEMILTWVFLSSGYDWLLEKHKTLLEQVGIAAWKTIISEVDKDVLVKFKEKSDKALTYVGYGQYDAGMAAFYTYYRNVLDHKEETEELLTLLDVSRCCCWWLPTDDCVFLSERPINIHVDEHNQLNNSSGPALEYSDGYKIYYVHGIEIEEDIIEDPKSITIKRINKEENITIRRIMIDKYGLKNYLRDLGSEVVDTDTWVDGSHRTLHKIKLKNDPEGFMQLVQVTNSTTNIDGNRDEYFIRVPKDVTTCQQAVAWTFPEIYNDKDLTDFGYHPDVET